MKTLGQISSLILLSLITISCADEGSVADISANENLGEGRNLVPLDATGLQNIFTDIFQLPAATPEETAAARARGADELLATARQFVIRYEANFDSNGAFGIFNQMKWMAAVGLACTATTVPELKSGDLQSIAMKALNRALDETEFSILNTHLATLSAEMRAQAACIDIVSAQEAYGVIR